MITQHSVPLAWESRHGVALVMVLMVLVLITVMVVGFLSLATTERQASAAYAEGSRVRMLSDTAVNLVIGQIRQATETLNDDPNQPQAWVSQPGMIRVFGTAGGSGNGRAAMTTAYKLYSSDTMRVTQFGRSEADAEAPPADWAGQPALYTDLNEPVASGGLLHYPVLNPPAAGEVEGFEIRQAPGEDSTAPVMPVKWLYVLRDGSVATAAAVPGDGGKVKIASATSANPVVGRVAFWTDDESSKVNINTASEGVFWDMPRANNVTERRLGTNLPARHEFQRYPGHPATVSLSTVLGNYLTAGGGSTVGDTSAGASQHGLYYDLAPRVATGGSLDGTRSPSSTMVVTKDQDRLYATVDEYLFKASGATGGRRTENSPRLTPDVLARTQFFLTAQSRAPELTLFGTPRVSLWPLQVVQPSGSTTARNAYDRLIAFCSSLGWDATLPGNHPSDQAKGRLYAFQRKQVTHLVDQNPASPSSASATADYDDVPRNQVLYQYLQRLTSREIPGFGGTFLEKYPRDRDQILTSCFDYSRSLVNAISTPQRNLTPHYSYAPYYYDFGVISPIRIGDTMGHGRFFTISQAAVLFYPAQVDATNPSDVKTLKMRARFFIQPYCITPGQTAFNQKYQVQVSGLRDFKADGLPLRMADAGGNTGLLNVNFNEGYYTADSWLANKTALPSPAGQFFKYRSGFGGVLLDAGSANHQFDVWASVADVDVTGKDVFTFSGGVVTVKVNLQNGTNIQTLKITFPSQTLPVPKRVGGLLDTGAQPDPGNPNLVNLNYRRRFEAGLPPNNGRVNVSQMLMNNLIYPGDTVSAMVVNAGRKARGDMRLVAYRSSLGEEEGEYFVPHPDVRGASLRVGFDPSRHQFRKDWTQFFKNSETGGRMVENLAYPESAIPMVPSALNGAKNQYDAPGDWDTGFDLQEDGPYVNKADEGATNRGYFTRGMALGFVSANFGDGSNGSQAAETDNITYSPNRQIASAVMFGSLPTGVHGRTPGTPEPWQTLLFNPRPAAGERHYGFRFPQDHLWLDLFWMPIVEPYAISEPFSTAGKVNLNYEIMPFRHLKRRTGLHAVLKSTRMTAIPDSEVTSYKLQTGTTHAASYRHEISADHVTGTLRGFENRFAAGDVFRSASEICTISLVPKGGGAQGATYDTMEDWWERHRLTGDNLRESPYNELYPRLTTRSNTFMVHYRVQTLRQSRSADPGEWDEARDLVQGEHRGSCLVERFVDPNDPELPDFASTTDLNNNGRPDESETLDRYYQFRVLQRRQFIP